MPKKELHCRALGRLLNLRHLVGIKALKPFQRDAIRTFVGGEMCLCLFPPGSASLYAMLFCRLCSTVCDRVGSCFSAAVQMRRFSKGMGTQKCALVQLIRHTSCHRHCITACIQVCNEFTLVNSLSLSV